MKLILASASPRRKQLLAQIGLSCLTRAAEIDETPYPAEKPDEYVQRLASDKAQTVLSSLQSDSLIEGDVIVLGSDTSVIIDGRILGKPECFDEFSEMMQCLSGRDHEVITGVALIKAKRLDSSLEKRVFLVRTRVRFRQLSDQDIQNYWKSGEPHDKAGGYGIQGLGAMFVSEIQGSYSNVVGLPLTEVAQALSELGFEVWSV